MVSEPPEEVKPALERLTSALLSIEQEFGVKPGFLRELPNGDDWSFIIKTHAVVEAMVSTLLTHTVGDTRLAEFFERLELGDPRAGKIAVAKNLEILDSHERRFIKLLSELRNRLVHNIRFVDFDLKAYFDQLDRNQRESFLLGASWWVSQGPEHVPEPVKSDPKSLLWFALLALIVQVNDRLSLTRSYNQELRAAMEFYYRAEDAQQ